MAPGEALTTAPGLPFQALLPYGRDPISFVGAGGHHMPNGQSQYYALEYARPNMPALFTFLSGLFSGELT